MTIRFGKAFALPCALLCASFFSSAASASQLGSLKGIKWKQELPPRGGANHDKVYGRLVRPTYKDGSYVEFHRIASQLKQKGVQAVAFRIDKTNRYVDENGNGSWDERNNYHQELADMIVRLDGKGIKSYLFARQWLTNRSDQEVFDLFDLFLSQHKNARNKVAGIGITESNIGSMTELKRRAKSLANTFNNSKYNNYLKTRGFIMPGLDMGFRFTNVNKNDVFHFRMQSKVGEFAFAVKAMKGKNGHNAHIAQGGKSVAEREAWLRNEMALDDLIAYQARSNYNNVNNIVFWGDNGDAMANIHPKAAQALHNVLHGSNSRGSFFFAPVADNTMEYKRVQLKSIVMFNRNTGKFYRHNKSDDRWRDSVGVYEQFDNWSSNSPRYH